MFPLDKWELTNKQRCMLQVRLDLQSDVLNVQSYQTNQELSQKSLITIANMNESYACLKDD